MSGNVNYLVVAAAVLAVAVAGAVLAAALLSRRAERRQNRLMGRLRHDSEQQAEAVLRLGENPRILAVKDAKAGKVDFRMDKTGNVANIAGKLSFDADKLVSNVNAVVSAVSAARPANVKGVFIKSLTLASTMGVGVPCIVAADAQ